MHVLHIFTHMHLPSVLILLYIYIFRIDCPVSTHLSHTWSVFIQITYISLPICHYAHSHFEKKVLTLDNRVINCFICSYYNTYHHTHFFTCAHSLYVYSIHLWISHYFNTYFYFYLIHFFTLFYYISKLLFLCLLAMGISILDLLTSSRCGDLIRLLLSCSVFSHHCMVTCSNIFSIYMAFHSHFS